MIMNKIKKIIMDRRSFLVRFFDLINPDILISFLFILSSYYTPLLLEREFKI